MIEGGSTNNIETSNIENAELKSSFPEKDYKDLDNLETKMNDLLFADDENIGEGKNEDVSFETTEISFEPTDISENEQEGKVDSADIKEIFNNLFADDLLSELPSVEETKSDDSNESNIEKRDTVLEKIAWYIGTPEGIKQLIENHPEKAELWKNELKALETLDDPDASPAEIRSAQAKLSILKGQLLEIAVKDALTEAGLDVEPQQRVVEGESGGTRPDVIAKNNTDKPITVFGVTIQPGETISVECKCGGTAYMTNQLNNHIPNQLSGQEGTKILLTTSDIKDTESGLADSVCEEYGATLVITDVSVSDVEKAIKEVANA